MNSDVVPRAENVNQATDALYHLGTIGEKLPLLKNDLTIISFDVIKNNEWNRIIDDNFEKILTLNAQ